MKSEADFVEGSHIVYVDSSGNRYTGVVDYSYGDEEPGHIRADKPNGAGVYVPIKAIVEVNEPK